MGTFTLFSELEQILNRVMSRTEPDGHWGSHEVIKVRLAKEYWLRAAMDEENAYWIQIVFTDGTDHIMVWPDGRELQGSTSLEVLQDIVQENTQR